MELRTDDVTIELVVNSALPDRFVTKQEVVYSTPAHIFDFHEEVLLYDRLDRIPDWLLSYKSLDRVSLTIRSGHMPRIPLDSVFLFEEEARLKIPLCYTDVYFSTCLPDPYTLPDNGLKEHIIEQETILRDIGWILSFSHNNLRFHDERMTLVCELTDHTIISAGYSDTGNQVLTYNGRLRDFKHTEYYDLFRLLSVTCVNINMRRHYG